MIEFANAGFSYRGESDIFSGISLALAPGSFHFLKGPSGSGKTTFLNLCTLALRPTSGHLTLFGRDAGTLDRNGVAETRQQIGVVHQDCEFLDHLSVEQNVSLPLMFSQRQGRLSSGEISDLLDWVGLSQRRRALPAELSGGERQRAALARAIVLSPQLIVADEPTGNVDWEMAQRLMQLLAELNRAGRTVLIATHDLNLIRATAKLAPARLLRISGKGIKQAGIDL